MISLADEFDVRTKYNYFTVSLFHGVMLTSYSVDKRFKSFTRNRRTSINIRNMDMPINEKSLNR